MIAMARLWFAARPFLGFLAVAVITAVLTWPLVFMVGEWSGARQERAEAEVRAGIKALERIKKLEENNEDFNELSDRDRCIVFMRDSGLPEHNCD